LLTGVSPLGPSESCQLLYFTEWQEDIKEIFTKFGWKMVIILAKQLAGILMNTES
jgi:hypothetical protein